ncbi:helix-turn-helix domain-containing protein [Ideonella sp. 4Y11]|uniref:Helix-turn-helix domain-containing protein n=1 Tax=Ideonella aquatica TaxID=2824119 RepID=A0A940YSX1_9BURK|nr:helix-turn-helix domain-containing protein [Ideonella aquatica]MBQ0961283.1 helix-turn-helix domain-containing protein [Ideonella aquatica]
MPIDSRLVAPAADLADVVRAFYWHDLRGADALSPAQRSTRVPPGPYNGLVWLIDGRAQLVECGGQAVERELPAVFLTGAHRHDYRSLAISPYCSFGLALQPGVLALLSGLELGAWRDRIDDARRALPADWQALLDGVAHAHDHAARIALCEAFLRPRWQALAPRQAGWVHLLRHAWRRSSLPAALALQRWSQRHLQRRSSDAVGLRPGEVERYLRTERAMLAVRDGHAVAAEAAAEHGFADQAHFSREVKATFAHSPAALQRRLASDDGDEDWLLRL